ncbi:MAG TPA: trypsin-like peptidase domain-containing protein [Methylomirabilota bacterium]|nr:trypsin-like peptidase domain-containing protein [Methylomirabilota bacterium]
MTTTVPNMTNGSLGTRCVGSLIGLLTLTDILRAAAPELAADPRRDAAVAAVERVMPSVVNIATEEVVPTQSPLEDLFREFFDPYYRRRPPNTQYSLGSGVIIDEEGFVVTNFHVVNRARRVWVKLHDGREFEAEKIAGTSLTDVALLKIRAGKSDRFAAVKFAADDDLLLGETVLALGNPFGLGGSVSRGILSSKSRRPPADNEPLDILDWLQTDASINPGNSGGPLVNLRGELIGISVAVHREGQGIGFAIPIKRVGAALAELYSPEVLEKLWFGARVRPAPPLRVISVQNESPAGRAGLKPGDEILQVNGHAPRGFIDFNRQLLAAGDKRDLTLLVQRGAAQRSLSLRMVPEDTFFNAALVRKKLGVGVEELTPRAARELGLSNQRGLVITDVDRQSSAFAARLDRGMVITALDGQVRSDVVSAAKFVYGKAKGDQIEAEVVFPRQRGPYVELLRTTVTLVVR